jgi:predicted transcriptional regulator
MQPNPPRPTDAELEILTVLWSRGASTVREVYETITARRAAQYTTILKLMQIMAEKGLVRRNQEQRAHVYEAAQSQEWTQQRLAGDLLRRAFDGSARNLMMGALSAGKTTRKELAELRKLLDEYEKRVK